MIANILNVPEIVYNTVMENKTLEQANPHLQDLEKALRQRLRSLASSTAIETGESIKKVEERIIRLRAKRSRKERV